MRTCISCCSTAKLVWENQILFHKINAVHVSHCRYTTYGVINICLEIIPNESLCLVPGLLITRRLKVIVNTLRIMESHRSMVQSNFQFINKMSINISLKQMACRDLHYSSVILVILTCDILTTAVLYCPRIVSLIWVRHTSTQSRLYHSKRKRNRHNDIWK